MSRERKPGDVGVLDSGVRVLYVGEDMERDEPRPWRTERGAALWGDMEIRPIVVIDPEDREQVARLCDGYKSIDHRRIGTIPMADALRGLIAPKPEEPVGLGAVVETATGKRYIRTADTDCAKPWSYANNYTDTDWSDIDAVKVLSEGVTA